MDADKLKAYEQWKNCEGQAFYNRINTYDVSFQIFENNASELEEYIVKLSKPKCLTRYNISSASQNVRERLVDLNRLLHNFLASAKTLIDHSRNFVSEFYSDTEIEYKYLQVIDEQFKNDELSRFINDLRNYMVHRGVPENQLSVSLTSDHKNVVCSLTLCVDNLKRWKRLSPASKKYLESTGCNSDLELGVFVTPYTNKISKMHSWLNSALTEFHKEHIKEYENYRLEYEKLTSC